MDEIEKRLAAVELLWIEAGAWMDPEILADAERSIAAGLAASANDEREIREQALCLIDAAQRRFKTP